jgi:hypothetical protein
MHLADAITIVVACPFLIAMTYRYMHAVQMLIAPPLIGVHHRIGLGETMHVLFERLSVGVMHHAQAHLMSVSPHRPHNRRAVIGVGAMPAPLVGSSTRRVVWVVMTVSLLAGVLEHLIALGTRVG